MIADPKNLIYREKPRLVGYDHAAVRRNAYLALGKGIQRIDRHIRRNAWQQMHLNLHLGSGIVDHFADLDLAGIIRLNNAVDHAASGNTIRYLLDGQRFLIDLFDLRPYLDLAAAQALVV